MATYLPAIHPAQQIDQHQVPLTLTALQTLVGGFIRFLDVPSGDVLIVNEASLDRLGFFNKTASSLVGENVYGDVVLCDPQEIA